MFSNLFGTSLISSQPASKQKCQVKDCAQSHTAHYCKFCKESNSDHFSVNCPQKKQVPFSSSNVRCRIQGCTDKHQQHFCKVCHNINSNHLAKNCPKGITLFHGTKFEFALSISKGGFIPSKTGCLGPGVYFTPDFTVAKDIAIGRSGGDVSAVIQCKLDEQNDQVQDRIHEPWFTSNQFKEYVVRSNFIHRIKIVKIHKL